MSHPDNTRFGEQIDIQPVLGTQMLNILKSY